MAASFNFLGIGGEGIREIGRAVLKAPAAVGNRHKLAAARARSGELTADKPARLAAASARRLQNALKSVCLEQADSAHVRAGLVDTVASGSTG